MLWVEDIAAGLGVEEGGGEQKPELPKLRAEPVEQVVVPGGGGEGAEKYPGGTQGCGGG